jgi:hypothetical protein
VTRKKIQDHPEESGAVSGDAPVAGREPQVETHGGGGPEGEREICALEGCDVPLPPRALDEHGRLKSGRRARYCCKGHADAASRQRRARDVAAVAEPLAQVRAVGDVVVPAARDLVGTLTVLIEHFEKAESGALGRVNAAERAAAEAVADSHAARQEAAASEQARRQAVARARDDRQARDNAVAEAERSGEEVERVRASAWGQVAEHERARGHAEAARLAAEQASASLAADNRGLRQALDGERARSAGLAEQLGAVQRDLERVRGDRTGLEARLEAAEHAAREYATVTQREIECATRDLSHARSEAEELRLSLEGSRRQLGERLAVAERRASALQADLAAERSAGEAGKRALDTMREALAASEARYGGLQAAVERLTGK